MPIEVHKREKWDLGAALCPHRVQDRPLYGDKERKYLTECYCFFQGGDSKIGVHVHQVQPVATTLMIPIL